MRHVCDGWREIGGEVVVVAKMRRTGGGGGVDRVAIFRGGCGVGTVGGQK